MSAESCRQQQESTGSGDIRQAMPLSCLPQPFRFERRCPVRAVQAKHLQMRRALVIQRRVDEALQITTHVNRYHDE